MDYISAMKLKIGFLTALDPCNKHSWSGTFYHMFKALSELHDVTPLGPIDDPWISYLLRLKNQISLRLFKKRFDWRHSEAISKAFAPFVEKLIQSDNFDVIIAPAGVALIANIKTSIPIIYIGDRTVRGALDYHQQLSNLSVASYKQSSNIEQKAFDQSLMISFPSHWAVNSVERDYTNTRGKVVKLAFGSNVENEAIYLLEKARKIKSPLQLLFVGVNWEGKGGPIAYNCLIELIRSGIDAELIVCGCTLPKKYIHPKIKNPGFLDKNDVQQLAQLNRHFSESDIFILPTKQEAFGIVFCEAALNGLPSFGPDTGGVSSALVNGTTGILLDKNASGEDYAREIKKIISSEETYQKLSHAAKKYALENFTWKKWAVSLIEEFEKRRIK